jgi:outer membrane lipoprotein carrier protein
MLRLTSSCIVPGVLIICMSATAGEPTAYSELLSDYLSSISTLSGNFEQRTSDQDNYDTTVYRGRLWISKPNNFRVNTTSPSVQSLVSNGTDFWSYDADLEQVIVSRLNEDLNQVPILLFSSDIAGIKDSYDISGYEDEDGEHFLLLPASEISLFQSVSLQFRGGIPVAIEINATSGQNTMINLKKVVVNESIPEARYNFNAPEDVDVIDDR